MRKVSGDILLACVCLVMAIAVISWFGVDLIGCVTPDDSTGSGWAIDLGTPPVKPDVSVIPSKAFVVRTHELDERIVRFYDPEVGSVCYVVPRWANAGGAISCFPLFTVGVTVPAEAAEALLPAQN